MFVIKEVLKCAELLPLHFTCFDMEKLRSAYKLIKIKLIITSHTVLAHEEFSQTLQKPPASVSISSQ